MEINEKENSNLENKTDLDKSESEIQEDKPAKKEDEVDSIELSDTTEGEKRSEEKETIQSTESSNPQENTPSEEEEKYTDTVTNSETSKTEEDPTTAEPEAKPEEAPISQESNSEEKEENIVSESEELKTPVESTTHQEAETNESNVTIGAGDSEADTSDSNDDSDEDDSKDDKEEEIEEEHHLDYSNYTKKQMVQVLESLLKGDNLSQVGKILKEIKKPYDEIAHQERSDAYNKYIEDGGEKDGFEYRGDELDQRFHLAFNKLRDKKNEYFNSLEIRKDQNLKIKLDILEKLRELVDSEETGVSIKDLKELQVQWKEVGPVPSSQLKSLWANYNALLDRFYDNRSIYFELKELDRKKNYDLKIELCEKAEQLVKDENIREVIKQLNELHEEFKHIGPVPKEDQDAVWDRFKAASDQIYSRRKDYYEQLKEDLKVNQVAKEALVEKVLAFADFDSEKISDWNAKTKEIIGIQKEWEAIGSLPKEKAKKINKQFWSAFKGFFNKKGLFFKKLEEVRKENLKLKEALVEKAESLKDNDDFKNTSEELKKLQKDWKEIGPVPEKFRNEVFVKFKKACDHFFNRRRSNNEVVEKEYVENLKTKQLLCDEIEKMVKAESIDVDRLKKIEAEWANIGYVPRNNIKSIQKRYTDAVNKATDLMDLSEDEKHKLRFKAQFNNMSFGPGSERLLQKKEGALRRQISNLENDISLWRNNIDFFAASKNADKLKKDFQVKIDQANAQLKNLKEQLKILSNI